MGRVGSRSSSGSDRVGVVSLTFLKKSSRVTIGSGRVNFFFKSSIDFDWIKDHLISGRVESGHIRVGSI
jgi:hypothetical protein